MRAGVIADEDDGGQAMEAGITHSASEFGAVGRGHVVVEKSDTEPASAQGPWSVRAVGEAERFDADGDQDLFNEVTCGALVVDNERASLQIGLGGASGHEERSIPTPRRT